MDATETSVLEKEPEIIVETAPEVVVEHENTTDNTPTVDESLDTLKRQLEAKNQEAIDERKGRLDAEKRAYSAETTARQATGSVDETNLQLIGSALEQTAQQQAIHKANLRTALQNGDADAMADAQEQIAILATRKAQLENGQFALEEHIERKRNAPPPVLHSDPVEQLASGLTPRSASWVRSHPEYVRDPRLNRKMIRAHEDAMDDRLSVDTDEYFQFIESRLGLGQQEVTRRNDVQQDDSPMSEASAPTARRTPPPAAPVTRSGTPNGQRPGVVRLSSQEKEMADMMGMTEIDYWKNKEALKREGKIH